MVFNHRRSRNLEIVKAERSGLIAKLTTFPKITIEILVSDEPCSDKIFTFHISWLPREFYLCITIKIKILVIEKIWTFTLAFKKG